MEPSNWRMSRSGRKSDVAKTLVLREAMGKGKPRWTGPPTNTNGGENRRGVQFGVGQVREGWWVVVPHGTGCRAPEPAESSLDSLYVRSGSPEAGRVALSASVQPSSDNYGIDALGGPA
jgi:hypothetical protein